MLRRTERQPAVDLDLCGLQPGQTALAFLFTFTTASIGRRAGRGQGNTAPAPTK
jgi:hypothetical protein